MNSTWYPKKLLGQIAGDLRVAVRLTAHAQWLGVLVSRRSSWLRLVTTKGKRRRAYEEALGKVRDRRATLVEASKGLEHAFLDLGCLLEQLPGASETLIHKSQNLLDLASGRSRGERQLQTTLEILSEPLAWIIHCTQVSAAKVRELESAVTRVDKILSRELELKMAMAPLLYVQRYLRIESAGLDPTLRSVFLSLAKEIAQLMVQVDLEKTDTEIYMAGDAIGTHADALDHMALQLPEFEHLTCSHDGMVEVLLRAIEDVRRIALEASAGIDAAYEAVYPIRGQTSNVTTTIRMLSTQMRLVALNAQIHAAHVGQGTGLDVLAGQIAFIANQSLDISERIATELDGQFQCISLAVEDFATLRDGCRGRCEILRVKGRAQEEALHRYRDEALSCLAETGEGICGLRTRATELRDSIRWRKIVAKELEPSITFLDEVTLIADELVRLDGGTTSPSAFMQTLAQHYTMASEIEVHQMALGCHETDPVRRPGTTIPDPDSVVELSEPCAILASGVGHTLTGLRQSATVDPVGVTGETVPDGHQVKGGTGSVGASLGDNVELF